MITTRLKRFFQPVPQPVFASAALLILRLVAGIGFIFHGSGKIPNPFDWLPPQAPISIPPLFQFLAAISEFGGGIGWVLGLLSPLASLGIGCTMAVAVYFHSMIAKDPFVNMTGGPSYEPALVFFAVALVILALGPGKVSLDKLIFGERK